MTENKQFVVYKLMDAGNTVYVGQSTSINSRVNSHMNDKTKDFSEVWYTEVMDKHEMDRLEMYLIGTLKPKYNKLLDLELEREYRVTYLNKDKNYEWYPHIPASCVDTTRKLINNIVTLRKFAQHVPSEPKAVSINLNWYDESENNIETYVDENDVRLKLSSIYDSTLVKQSLVKMSYLNQDQLYDTIIDEFCIPNLPEEKAELYRTIQTVYNIASILQERETHLLESE